MKTAYTYHHIPYDERRTIINIGRSIFKLQSKIRYTKKVKYVKDYHIIKLNDIDQLITLLRSAKKEIVDSHPLRRFNSYSLCSTKKKVARSVC